jgi:hypothetical protein
VTSGQSGFLLAAAGLVAAVSSGAKTSWIEAQVEELATVSPLRAQQALKFDVLLSRKLVRYSDQRGRHIRRSGSLVGPLAPVSKIY